MRDRIRKFHLRFAYFIGFGSDAWFNPCSDRSLMAVMSPGGYPTELSLAFDSPLETEIRRSDQAAELGESRTMPAS